MSVSAAQKGAAASCLVSLAVASVLSAAAQAAFTAEAESAESLDEVVVTGSRVIREGMSSPTPVTSLSSEELLESNPQSISQALALLPSMSGSTTPKSIGGRTTLGVGSFLNLRNLGTNRNLVLLDGRRVVPANIAGNTDINLLPQGLISNVSVVTGGASAAYGSDAVAGVTNFILNTRFEGFKADINAGSSSRGDGESYKAALAWGASLLDDRLHLTASFDWRHSLQAYKENRAWANRSCALIPIPGVTTANMSVTNPRQTIACNVTQPSGSYGGAIIAGPLTTASQGITFGPGGVPEAFTYGTLRSTNLQVGGEGNFVGDTANFSTPTDNKVLFTHAVYELSDQVEAFVQATIGRADSKYTQTPPFFTGTTAIQIFSGNPFIPASLQQRMTTLNTPSFNLNVVAKSWGTIDIDSNYRARDFVTGLKGSFGDDWNWDVHYQTGQTKFNLQYINQISLERAHRAADAVLVNGVVVCQSAIANPAAYGDCVPLNPFGEGAPSQAALNYIHGASQPWNTNLMKQQSAGANINGQPFSSWAGPVSLGAGVEWRKLDGDVDSDSVSNTVPAYTGVRGLPAQYVGRVGGWSTSNVLPTSGSYNVKEAYVETLVPLAKDLFLARAFDLNAAFRTTDYSQSGTVETWKLGVTWRPIDDLLLRATRSRDIRAPGIGDLYSRDMQGPNALVTDASLPNRPQVSIPVVISGNPALTPEKAKTTTYGLTYQPSFLPGFGASVDYYDIRIADVLQSVSANETVERCVLGQQIFCDNVTRVNGVLTSVRTRTQNLAQARTKGVDLDFNYRTQIMDKDTTFRVIGTRLLEQSTTTPNATTSSYVDRVGDINMGFSKWILTAMTNVDFGALAVNANARFIGKGKYNTTYVPGDIAPEWEEVGSMLTLDVGARYRLEMEGKPELYVNVANVLDRAPPMLPSSALVGAQTNERVYDTLGRYFTAGFRIQF
jgi:iron complex outermembrane recepter protein